MPTRNFAIVPPLGTHSNGTVRSGLVREESSELYSSGHYGWQSPNGNVGGPFMVSGLRGTYNPVSCGIITNRGSATDAYSGSLVCIPPGDPPLISGDGSSFGADAYDKMKPTKPSFESLNALYELKDLPGMLRQRFHKSGLKNIGSYWLALQFGWRPLLNDCIKLVQLQRSLEKRLTWLLRNNGKPVRRRIQIASSSESSTVFYPSVIGHVQHPSFVTRFLNGARGYNEVTTLTDRVWASARFRYWLPDGPRDIDYKRRLLAELYGLSPRPSVIYNMMPWTWLLDWFTSAGDVVSNLDAGVADRLAADYFYVMREKHAIIERHSFCGYYGLARERVVINAFATKDRFLKTRLKGDPFGFNTSENDLTGMQLSILGALGLSRL